MLAFGHAYIYIQLTTLNSNQFFSEREKSNFIPIYIYIGKFHSFVIRLDLTNGSRSVFTAIP